MAENGNGNGEIKQLVGVKHAYRGKVASLEADLRAKFEADLTEGKKRLKEEYLEAVVDVVFADDASLPIEVNMRKAEVSLDVTPKISMTVETKYPGKCPECGSDVRPNDKFCAECAYPLQDESVSDEDPRRNLLGTTGRQRWTSRRP
jgi:hypothetical protein